MRKRFIMIGISLAITLFSVMLYEMWIFAGIVFFVALILTVPQIQRSWKKAKEEAEEYQMVTEYLEQVLCSYKRTEMIVDSMEDCLSIFQENTPMYSVIYQALHILHTGEGVENGEIARAAFQVVERRFPSRRLRMVHRFLCEAEKMGGNREASLDILLEDLQMWKRRTSLYQKRKSYIRVETMVALGMAFLMCYISKLLTPSELGFHLTDSVLYQCSTVFVFCCFLLVMVFMWRKLTGSWLDYYDGEDERGKAKLKRNYEILKGNVQKCSLLQRHMAKKIVRRQIEREFPYWLLSISLLLQTDSVYHAIQESVVDMSEVFSLEVNLLLIRIYEEPNELYPYVDFFQELHMKEIQTGMKILYSVNQNGYQDSENQLGFLVSQNNQLMDQSERNRYTNQTAGLSMMKHLPMVTACIKLLIDLVNLLVMTMGAFQSVV